MNRRQPPAHDKERGNRVVFINLAMNAGFFISLGIREPSSFSCDFGGQGG